MLGCIPDLPDATAEAVRRLGPAQGQRWLEGYHSRVATEDQPDGLTPREAADLALGEAKLRGRTLKAGTVTFRMWRARRAQASLVASRARRATAGAVPGRIWGGPTQEGAQGEGDGLTGGPEPARENGGPPKGIDRFFDFVFAKVLNTMKVLLPATRSPRVRHVA